MVVVIVNQNKCQESGYIVFVGRSCRGSSRSRAKLFIILGGGRPAKAEIESVRTCSWAKRSLCSRIVSLSLRNCTSSARIIKLSVRVLVSSS